MEELENELTEEEAQRLVEWVIGHGHSEQEAYEALAYTMGVKVEAVKNGHENRARIHYDEELKQRDNKS